jgi:hypothetical protein
LTKNAPGGIAANAAVSIVSTDSGVSGTAATTTSQRPSMSCSWSGPDSSSTSGAVMPAR